MKKFTNTNSAQLWNLLVQEQTGPFDPKAFKKGLKKAERFEHFWKFSTHFSEPTTLKITLKWAWEDSRKKERMAGPELGTLGIF